MHNNFERNGEEQKQIFISSYTCLSIFFYNNNYEIRNNNEEYLLTT